MIRLGKTFNCSFTGSDVDASVKHGSVMVAFLQRGIMDLLVFYLVVQIYSNNLSSQKATRRDQGQPLNSSPGFVFCQRTYSTSV